MAKRKPKRKRRTHSDEFKREAVKLVIVEGLYEDTCKPQPIRFFCLGDDYKFWGLI